MVDAKYRAGTGTFTCPECNASLDVECNGIGFSDLAYCEDCKIKYTRSRSAVVEDDKDGFLVVVNRTEKDEYEEYECDDCGGDTLHEKTLPKGEFEAVGGIHVYGDFSIVCPCGIGHYELFAPNDPIECECGRTHNYNIDF